MVTGVKLGEELFMFNYANQEKNKRHEMPEIIPVVVKSYTFITTEAGSTLWGVCVVDEEGLEEYVVPRFLFRDDVEPRHIWPLYRRYQMLVTLRKTNFNYDVGKVKLAEFSDFLAALESEIGRLAVELEKLTGERMRDEKGRN